jgi:hypothetical protein
MPADGTWDLNRRVNGYFTKPFAVAQLVEALRYKPEGRGFDSQFFV